MSAATPVSVPRSSKQQHHDCQTAQPHMPQVGRACWDVNPQPVWVWPAMRPVSHAPFTHKFTRQPTSLYQQGISLLVCHLLLFLRPKSSAAVLSSMPLFSILRPLQSATALAPHLPNTDFLALLLLHGCPAQSPQHLQGKLCVACCCSWPCLSS